MIFASINLLVRSSAVSFTVSAETITPLAFTGGANTLRTWVGEPFNPNCSEGTPRSAAVEVGI